VHASRRTDTTPPASAARTPESTLADVALLGKVVTSFAEYVDTGGGRGLEVALGASPEAVIDEVAKSGLRGRGGAGFPTGEKWRSIRTTGTGSRFAVCNGAEGEPATFKDRALMRTNPYQILEGLAIAGYAIGAERCYIGIKETFTEEVRAISRALEEMREADALGGKSFPGKVLFAALTGTNTGGVVTFPVRVGLAGSGGLRPGMNVSVRIIVAERHDVVQVPLEAVSHDEEDRAFVTVIDAAGETSPRNVTLGLEATKNVEIVKGLRPGERVVLPESQGPAGEE